MTTTPVSPYATRLLVLSEATGRAVRCPYTSVDDLVATCVRLHGAREDWAREAAALLVASGRLRVDPTTSAILPST